MVLCINQGKSCTRQFKRLKDVNLEKTKRWFECPGFLGKSQSECPTQVSVDIVSSDPEVKAILTVNLAAIECDSLPQLEAKF